MEETATPNGRLYGLYPESLPCLLHQVISFDGTKRSRLNAMLRAVCGGKVSAIALARDYRRAMPDL